MWGFSILELDTRMNQLVEHFLASMQNLRGFEVATSLALGSDHVGAIVAEAVLQPGSRYKRLVRPRIEKIMKDYPKRKTSGDFVRLLEEISPKYFLNWEEEDKPRRVLAVAKYLHNLGIETKDEFYLLFDEPDFPKVLKEIRGIGNKHIDSMKLLLRYPCESLHEAVRLVFQEMNIPFSTFEESRVLFQEIAHELKLDYENLLLCFWRYESNR